MPPVSPVSRGALGVLGVTPRLTLLDGVRWDDSPVPGDRPARLLVALTESAPRALSAGALIEAVWEDEPVHPEKALQVLVSRVRSRTTAEAVELTAGGYRLALAPEEVDLLWLRVRADDAARAHAAGDLDAARLAAAEALAIRVGGASSGPAGPVVLLAHALRDRARRTLAGVLLAQGQTAVAWPLLSEALVQSPDDEELLAEALRAEAEVHGVAAALQRYAHHAEDLRERLGSDPGPAVRRLHAELLARESPVRSGLRHDASPLVGRDDDVVAIRALLHRSRVVSILGPGGLGKTRIAHLVGRLASQPVVQLVELAGVSDAAGVVPEVARVLGAGEANLTLRARRGGAPNGLRHRIAEQIQAPTLLVLDNCEHLLSEVADLVLFLVGSTDQVQVLTTTRAPLGIAAEQVYPLPQLPVDHATALFVQRARAARPDARLAPEQVRVLAERLDGLPLALELAAAKVRVLALPQIISRLEDRFALLVGDRSVPERHQTLEAVIAWSWNLLRPDDQTALARLTVFPDGFDLAGAEAVLGSTALGSITELVDQSLLVVTDATTGEGGRALPLPGDRARVRPGAAGRER